MVDAFLAKDLLSLGIKPDDTLLVHSSLSSLGYIEGGAKTVIETLLSLLPNGTLLMPSLSYESVKAPKCGFSLLHTPSCVGIIPETFRKTEGVIRSMHPTHSVCAVGKYSNDILSHHMDTDTPAGEMSPFALLPKYGGKILMLGCGLKPNTSMHAIEEKMNVSYVLTPQKTMFELTDSSGIKIQKPYYCHNIRSSGYKQRYDKLSEIMDIKFKKVLKSDSCLLDSSEMWKNSMRALEKNEFFFTEPI